MSKSFKHLTLRSMAILMIQDLGMKKAQGKLDELKPDDCGLMMDLVIIMKYIFTSKDYENASFEYCGRIFTWNQLVFVNEYVKRNPTSFIPPPTFKYDLVSLDEKGYECYKVIITDHPTYNTANGYKELYGLYATSCRCFESL